MLVKEKQTKDQHIKEEKYKFPQKGEVEFRDVKMRYREDLNYVLNKLSFKLEAG